MKNNNKSFNDIRGSLLPIEFDGLPFIPQRLFVVNEVPVKTIRGGHSHYKTKQLIICTNGTVIVNLHDGISETTHTLNKNESIMVPELVWDSQQFMTKGAEIIVLCSTEYDINDYILDFDVFLKITGQIMSNIK